MSFLTFFLMKLLFLTSPEDKRTKGTRKKITVLNFPKKVIFKFLETWIPN